jgi:1,4-alpha-glucan branching enzyme
MTPRRSASDTLTVSREDHDRLVGGTHTEPHRILGAHPAGTGAVVRAFHPDAKRVQCLLPDAEAVEMERIEDRGLFGVRLAGRKVPVAHRLRFHFEGGRVWERADPYRFLPTIGDVDVHLFNEGTHRRLWSVLGANVRRVEGTDGIAFAVWAPNATRVSVVGDFCQWDGRLLPMRQLGSSGIFELFVPELVPGTFYKYEIRTKEGALRLKSDPFARSMELPPGTASRVYQSSYDWRDADWIARRPKRDPAREPLAVYEVHIGSWARVPEEQDRWLTYTELAPKLAAHVERLGFTHVEFLPVCEHPFTGSWGYQVSGYYAPTARYGTPDEFRYLVDHLHQRGIGVILDWVPAHFPKDDFALRRFDGSALFEHEDPRLGEHPDWGSLIFNYGRNEVRNFLVANALYWLEEFHVDGLRVDAVASMLYRDYSRREGDWIPNRYGGRENLEAIDFLRQFTEAVRQEHPGCITIAEESTAWPGVTNGVSYGGLGFDFKWNMGWMHDTLEYITKDPVHRHYHHDQLTFAMLYEHTERFLMPLSHDEVVHGKGSFLRKMPGDDWQAFANLRLLYGYQYTRPGKQLLFMGSEFAPDGEWNHDVSLDWHRADDPLRAGLLRYFEALGRLYRETPAFWLKDPDPDGTGWIDCQARDQSVIAYVRRAGMDDHVVVVVNFTPVPRDDYRIGAPIRGTYHELLSSDDPSYGGSGYDTVRRAETDDVPFHGLPQSMRLRLPPLGLLVLAPER